MKHWHPITNSAGWWSARRKVTAVEMMSVAHKAIAEYVHETGQEMDNRIANDKAADAVRWMLS